MTLSKFQKLLKKVNPKLTLRIAGNGDRGGLFAGRFGREGYIVRISKGELNLNGYRTTIVSPDEESHGRITKRGRKTLVMILRNRRWLKDHRDVSLLMGYLSPESYDQHKHGN